MRCVHFSRVNGISCRNEFPTEVKQKRKFSKTKISKKRSHQKNKMQSLSLTVCSHGGANFSSISDAIKNAGAGDIIILKAGQYDERVVLEKTLTIRGESADARKEVIIAGGFVSTTDNAVLANVTVQQGIDIRSGSCKIENVEVEFGDGVKVGQGAQAAISKCRITGAHQLGDGIYFQEGSRGVVSECVIENNRVNGIHLKGAEVDIIKNTIKTCRFGIYYRRGAKGTCEGNVISEMTSHGIYSVQSSTPVVTKNEISTCGVQGLIVSAGAGGSYRENIIKGNVHILTGTTAQCDSNTITGFYDNELIGLSTSGGGTAN